MATLARRESVTRRTDIVPRRTGVLPEEYRRIVFSTKNPFSVGVYLVDGRAAGSWSIVDGRVELDAWRKVGAKERREVERERAALEAFHA